MPTCRPGEVALDIDLLNLTANFEVATAKIVAGLPDAFAKTARDHEEPRLRLGRLAGGHERQPRDLPSRRESWPSPAYGGV